MHLFLIHKKTNIKDYFYNNAYKFFIKLIDKNFKK